MPARRFRPPQAGQEREPCGREQEKPLHDGDVVAVRGQSFERDDERQADHHEGIHRAERDHERDQRPGTADAVVDVGESGTVFERRY